MTFRRVNIEAATEQDAYDVCERRAKDEGYRVLHRDHATPVYAMRSGRRCWDVSLTVARR